MRIVTSFNERTMRETEQELQMKGETKLSSEDEKLAKRALVSTN